MYFSHYEAPLEESDQELGVAEDAAVEVPAEVMDKEVLEFIRAMDDYKRLNRRQFPTWGEVLRVVRTLGYKRTV